MIGANPVLGPHYTESANWDNWVPVQKRRITLDFPPKRPVHYRWLGPDALPMPAARESDIGGRHLVRFEGDDLPAVVSESLTPPDALPLRFVQFSEFSTWSEVANWADKLLQSGDSAAMPNRSKRSVATWAISALPR